MSNYFTKDQYDSMGALTDGGTLVYQAPVPIAIKRIVLITTAAYTVANTTVTVIVRDNDDTPSETKGTFPIVFTGSVIGDVLRVELIGLGAQSVGVDGSIVQFAADGFIELRPGQEFVLVDAGTQTAGASNVWIEFEKLGNTGYPASSTTNVVKTPLYTAS